MCCFFHHCFPPSVHISRIAPEGKAEAYDPPDCALCIFSYIPFPACCVWLLFSTSSSAHVAARRAAVEKVSLQVGRSLLVDAPAFESIEAVIVHLQKVQQ